MKEDENKSETKIKDDFSDSDYVLYACNAFADNSVSGTDKQHNNVG